MLDVLEEKENSAGSIIRGLIVVMMGISILKEFKNE